MALARQSFTEGTGSGNDNCSVTVPSCATGDTIIIAWVWHTDASRVPSTYTCPSETVTLLGSTLGGAGMDNWRCQWVAIANVANSGGKTITCTLTGAPTAGYTNRQRAWRLSGADTTTPDDGASIIATGTSTTPTLNLTTTVFPDGIFSVQTSKGAAPTGFESGFTSETVSADSWYMGAQYDIDVGSPGTKAVGYTLASSNEWSTCAIAIKESGATAGGGVPKTTRLTMLGVG
jgi:hypothetical protein